MSSCENVSSGRNVSSSISLNRLYLNSNSNSNSNRWMPMPNRLSIGYYLSAMSNASFVPCDSYSYSYSSPLHHHRHYHPHHQHQHHHVRHEDSDGSVVVCDSPSCVKHLNTNTGRLSAAYCFCCHSHFLQFLCFCFLSLRCIWICSSVRVVFVVLVLVGGG